MNRFNRTGQGFFLKLFITICIITFCCSEAFAQQKYSIDYFGIVADGVDDNMSKMTSDLYYSQLCEINSYIVQYKRTGIKMDQVPSTSSFEDGNLSLFAVISRKENSNKWISSINLYDSSRKATYSESKEYDSFYKILMEPKASLQETISNLMAGKSDAIAEQTEASGSKTSTKLQSTEVLSGTWGGEDSIDKIVIMRGGRGFVIFKNGASMNISVEIKANNDIVITQSGKANASFFTEIPRDLALKEAVNADPIKWTLSLDDENTLTGTKSTLILSDGTAQSGTLNVTWKRKS